MNDWETLPVIERSMAAANIAEARPALPLNPYSVEHIIPRTAGGATTAENLALSCQGCNNHKYTKTTGTDPSTEQTVPLFHPRQHRWNDHFVWNHDYTLLLGISPTGRATIETLKLNRVGLVNLRLVLYAIAEHPLALE